jgi:hypothetical protein
MGIILAVAPYFSFSQPDRTQFFAAPVQAIGWTLVMVWVGTFLAQRLQQIWLIAAAGFLVYSATVGAFQYQDTQMQISAPFNKIAYIFDQLHRLAPRIKPGTLVLLDLSGIDSPFGRRNYQLIVLSRLTLGVDAFQANLPDMYGRQPTFASDGITLLPDPQEPPGRVTHYPYDQVIGFQVTANLTVLLLDTFPKNLLPPGVSAEGYTPYARIQAGDSAPLRFLHYSGWMAPYQALPDIVNNDDHIWLGANWYNVEQNSDVRWRWVDNDAELLVTGADNASLSGWRVVTIDLQPGPGLGGQPLDLQIVDEMGQTLTTIEITQRETVHIALPVSVGHLARFWLRTTSRDLPTPNGDPRILNFQVFSIR